MPLAYGELFSASSHPTLNFLVHLITKYFHIQYCAKVMQTIIVEYRENRDISAIFNANELQTIYRAIYRNSHCFISR